MPPVNSGEAESLVNKLIAENSVFIFSKTTCPFCVQAKTLLNDHKIMFKYLELDKNENGNEIHAALKKMYNQTTVPNIFINQKHIGGFDNLKALKESNELMRLVSQYKSHEFEFDLIVIGGGSGGLSASKEAATLGAKVLVVDYVEPTPLGTTWGLGGTCVNVGCIPKKLMHQSALLKHYIDDSVSYGWTSSENSNHNWSNMVEEIQNHIGSLNFGYRVALRDKKVEYRNAYATFVDRNTLQLRNRAGEISQVTSQSILICTGERPRYLGIENDDKYCITSDDLFSLQSPPGKTLVVGASYVALECAGFLTSLGFDTSIMVRSIFLRGFDQQISEMIGDYMSKHGTKIIRPCIPTKIEKLQDEPKPLYKVEGKFDDGTVHSDTYNTILLAVGRDPCTKNINLEKISVELSKSGRVICDNNEKTSVENVYAIGDILAHGLQLTPVAIQAGKLLARRLYSNSNQLTDYTNVATTVFTPLEYGCIGLAEEDAIKLYGEHNIEVYHTFFKPLEWTVAHREDNACYAKLVCNKADNERVVGFHILSPNAGEVTQGFALGFKFGATKDDFDSIIGIHPTIAEIFTTLKIKKSSGESPMATGC